MTRRDAIIHARALLRQLDAAGTAPGWRAALDVLIKTAEAAQRRGKKR